MRLHLSETHLSRDERELWHFLAGFLPERSLIKLRALLQFWLGAFLHIGGDRVLLDTLPVHLFGQKPLQDLALRSELWILLNLSFHDLCSYLGKLLSTSITMSRFSAALRWLWASPRVTTGESTRAIVIKQQLSSILMTLSSLGYVDHMQEEPMQGEEVCVIQPDALWYAFWFQYWRFCVCLSLGAVVMHRAIMWRSALV